MNRSAWLACVGVVAALGTVSFGQSAKPDASAEVYRRFFNPAHMKVLGPGYKLAHMTPGNAVWWMEYTVPSEDAAPGETATSGLEGKLERTLPAGRYLAFMTIFNPNPSKDATGPVEIRISLGDSTGTLKLGRSKFAFGRVVIDAAKPFDTVRLAVATPEAGLFLGNFFLSNRLGDYGLNSPEFQHELFRQESLGLAGYTAEPDNWIADGSFEVGTGTFDWSTPYKSGYVVSPNALDTTNPADGKRCLCLTQYPTQSRFKGDNPDLPTDFSLYHRILLLNPGTTYYFRGMFRSETKAAVTISAEGFSWTGMPGQGKKLASVRAQLGDKWQPVQFKFTTSEKFSGFVLLSISSSAPGPDKLWVDALTLSAKPTEKFVPAAPVEVGAQWTALGRLFHVTDPPTVTLLARNYSGGGPATVQLWMRVVDYWGRTILDRTTKDWNVAAGETASRKLVLGDSPTGAFRLLLDGTARTADGREIALQPREYVFSVLNKPPDKMHHTFGTYANISSQPIEILSRAGIRKIVTLAYCNELLQDWNRMEPKEGKYVWMDRRVAAWWWKTYEVDMEAADHYETPLPPNVHAIVDYSYYWMFKMDHDVDADGNILRYRRRSWTLNEVPYPSRLIAYTCLPTWAAMSGDKGTVQSGFIDGHAAAIPPKRICPTTPYANNLDWTARGVLGWDID